LHLRVVRADAIMTAKRRRLPVDIAIQPLREITVYDRRAAHDESAAGYVHVHLQLAVF
jgi:hypothetical protein